MRHDTRFAYSRDQSGLFHVHAPRRRTAADLTALYGVWESDVTAAETLAGRPLSAPELHRGIDKGEASPDVLARHQGELNPPPVKLHSDEIALQFAQQRAEDERLKGLTVAQRQLHFAATENAKAAERRAKEQAAAKIRESAEFRALRERLDDLEFAAKFDPSVSADARAELAHQSTMLELNLDIPTVSANLATIQRAAVAGIDTQVAGLKSQVTALEQRRSALNTGLGFDAVTSQKIGDVTYVALTVGGKTVQVTDARYQARQSDEALRTELFAS